ncbi:MAG: metallophosphoesterase [Candidatus Baldrarchaeia archaeon]
MKEELGKIVQQIVEEGYQISPEALEYLSSLNEKQLNMYLDRILTAAQREDVFVITLPFVKEILKVEEKEKIDVEKIPARLEIVSSPSTQIELRITSDVLVSYFREKYRKLKRILEIRHTYQNIKEVIERKHVGEDVKIIGMILDKSEDDDIKFVVEDETGILNIRIPKQNSHLFEEAKRYLPDQVIYIEGKLTEAQLIEAKSLELPDILPAHKPKGTETDIYVAFISDLHIGHPNFQAESFEDFLDWLKNNGRKKVKYLLVAGDLINNPKEEENYDVLYNYLKEVPASIEVIVIPGETDATLPILPQPPITRNIEKIVKMYNVKVLGNPALIKIHNISVLLFHGLGTEKLMEKINLKTPIDLAKFLLKSRHLCPSYGTTPLIPHPGDLLTISSVPDIFHLGHFHLAFHDQYNGVHIISSGAWIPSNEKNLNKLHCQVPIMNLKSFEVKILTFVK